ncbi:hypothetical protein BX666DRAFT_1987900 [Dichotomocladium elegans]|nr:hypothetical protein BX666DRAFT_1987900 [Dichotomocladium elegans]
MAPEHQQQNKRIKWAKMFSPHGHVQKRSSARRQKQRSGYRHKTAPQQSQKQQQQSQPQEQDQEQRLKPLYPGTVVDRKSEIQHLENELGHSLDTLATISVMYNSILHAYNASRSELDRTRSDTRLGEMEKELLTAYDDLVLQVTHLQRRIGNMEKRLSELNAEVPSSSPQPSLMSDCGGNESPLSAVSYDAPPPQALLWPDNPMFIGCSSAAPYHPSPTLPPLISSQQPAQQQMVADHYHRQVYQQEYGSFVSPSGPIYLHS